MAFLGEVFRLPAGALALVVSLSRDETMNLLVSALLLRPEARLSEGSLASAFLPARLACLGTGDSLLASLLDPLGQCLLLSCRLQLECLWVIESPAPGIIER